MRAFQRYRLLRRVERVAAVLGALERRQEGPLRERASGWLKEARAAAAAAGAAGDEIDELTVDGLERGRFRCERVWYVWLLDTLAGVCSRVERATGGGS